jgi:hypothetical protein
MCRTAGWKTWRPCWAPRWRPGVKFINHFWQELVHKTRAESGPGPGPTCGLGVLLHNHKNPSLHGPGFCSKPTGPAQSSSLTLLHMYATRPAKAQAHSIKPKPDPSPHFASLIRSYWTYTFN